MTVFVIISILKEDGRIVDVQTSIDETRARWYYDHRTKNFSNTCDVFIRTTSAL